MLQKPIFAALLAALTATTSAPSAQEESCVDPQSLVKASAFIARYYEQGEGPVGARGAAGSAFFLSSTKIVTVKHVTDAMHLSTEDWKEIMLHQDISPKSEGTSSDFFQARLLRYEETGLPEMLAIIELEKPFEEGIAAQLREAPLREGEKTFAIGYQNGKISIAKGEFSRVGRKHFELGSMSGFLLFEMTDGNNRHALDHGASGAPVFDCQGNAVAVISNVIINEMTFAGTKIRVTPPWQQPNNAAVPVSALKR